MSWSNYKLTLGPSKKPSHNTNQPTTPTSPLLVGRFPARRAMSRHSKHSNDRMFFTAKERADAGYSNTRKVCTKKGTVMLGK